jgi:hypothetical protein
MVELLPYLATLCPDGAAPEKPRTRRPGGWRRPSAHTLGVAPVEVRDAGASDVAGKTGSEAYSRRDDYRGRDRPTSEVLWGQ